MDLERAVAQLPEGCRAAFVLHDVEGLEHREVADALGIAEGTSKSQVHKARLRLRALLGGGRHVAASGTRMYCNRYRDAIQELVDGTLGPVRRAELQTHLDQCDDCRALAARPAEDPRCRRQRSTPVRRPTTSGCRSPDGCARKGRVRPLRPSPRRHYAPARDRGGVGAGDRRLAAALLLPSGAARRRRRRPQATGASAGGNAAASRCRPKHYRRSEGRRTALPVGHRQARGGREERTTARSIRRPRRCSRRTSRSSTRRSRRAARR